MKVKFNNGNVIGIYEVTSVEWLPNLTPGLTGNPVNQGLMMKYPGGCIYSFYVSPMTGESVIDCLMNKDVVDISTHKYVLFELDTDKTRIDSCNAQQLLQAMGFNGQY